LFQRSLDRDPIRRSWEPSALLIKKGQPDMA
jgi:hypothetical protein